MGKKILIIDDWCEIRHVIALTLSHMGYETSEAKDGYEGLKKSITETPDLILLDVSLPGLSGVDLARTIKDNPQTTAIPIVGFSGCIDNDMKARALQAGIEEFLLKPVAAETLAAVIERLTAKSG